MKDRYYVTIECASDEEKMALGTSIHEQLAGNPNYYEDRIILNVDQDKTIRIWVEDNCVDLPIINLDLNKK